MMKKLLSLSFLKKVLKLSVIGVALAGLTVAASNYAVFLQTEDQLYCSVEDIPHNKIGLVLGCSSKTKRGNKNLYFEYRIDAAVKLFKAGKVDHLIVSGDNHTKNYDESTDMKNALIERGIPADRVVCDFAGFRTLDSIVRTKEVFQELNVTVISQEFHNQRALFIAKHKGMNAIAYNAKSVHPSYSYKTRIIREPLARVKTVLDLFILDRQPRFLGKTISIGS